MTTAKGAGARIGAGRSVLLIDDDTDFLDAVSVQLESLGFEVRTCESIAEGSRSFGDAPPDLAIVDLMLDEPDGGFVLCHLMKNARPDLPVIVCSAVKSETGMDFDIRTEQERSWIKADAWMPKPIRLEQLTHEIQRLLGGA